MRILLVDDDATLVDLLARTLAELNYAIDIASDGEQGWVYGSTYQYDLIILDWSLPKLDGISLCRRLRSHQVQTPIILLTSRQGSQNKIQGLDAGADDYICKPFDVEELSARIRALLRRLNCDFLPVLHWGKLQLDPCTCQVTYQNQDISLGAKEYRLLELFLRHPQGILSIEDIINSLWSSMEYPAEATVRSHIRHLRDKLKAAGLPEDLIATVRGQGYCLKSQTAIDSDPAPIDKTQRQLAALKAIWTKHQPRREQQLAVLEQAIAAWQTGDLELSDRLSAIISAHSLAGNLGQFGLSQGAKLAKDIEELLQQNPESEQWQELSAKLTSLKAELASNHDISAFIQQKNTENTSLLFLVGADLNLTPEAQTRGIRIQTFPNPEALTIWLEQNRGNASSPQAILLNISFTNFEPILKQEYLTLIAELKLIEPAIPVIVVADRDRFEDRLLVTRHGGSLYLNQSLTPRQIIDFCQQIIQNSAKGKKILIVDDDEGLLQALPSLLEPWGFQLTTLEDPRQFWDVLPAVNPDLLVLDVEMPHFSGIELCKVLRTHAYWHKLPVLFLSAHSDRAISNQVFASGANDFVTKPVIPQQLAHRIVNRLNYQLEN